MGAALDNLALLNHQNLIGLGDGAEPMGDYETGAIAQESIDRGLHQCLSAGVNAACRLIQNENARIHQHGAGNADELTLALAEV